MTELNIITSEKRYDVTEAGEIVFILTDTKNSYADGSNPTKAFSVLPVGDTMDDLMRALILTKEEAIDYFRGEAEKIARRKLIETGMQAADIPAVIFTGDPDKYVKTIKKGESNEELIIKDTIVVTPYDPKTADSFIYNVTAYVMQPSENRRDALQVSVTWNKNAGYTKLKELLILEYRTRKTPSSAWIQGEIRNTIGTQIPS
jgi:hypothetical protein